MTERIPKQKNKTEIFEKKSVTGAVLMLSIPTVLSQIMNTVYNFADTWFLGRTGDKNAVAAISVAMPFFVIMTAISGLFGIGASGVISRALGEKNEEEAKKAFCFAVWSSVAVSAVYGVAVYLFREQITVISGADEGTKKYVREYLFWAVTLGSVPSTLSAVFAGIVRSVGKSFLAGGVLSLGAVLNILLDPFFMFVVFPEGNEVKGVGTATLVSSVVSCIIFIICMKKSGEKIFDFNIKNFLDLRKSVGSVLMMGLPSFLSATLAMVSNITANKLMSSYSNGAVAGFGVAKKATTLTFNINMGFSQGVLPLVGYNFTSKMYDRVKKSVFVTLAISVSFSIFCAVFFCLFAKPVTEFFISEPETVECGEKFLPVLAVSVPVCAVSFIVGMFFQATGKKGYALITSILRKGIIDIPLMLLFNLSGNKNGIVFATPTAEVLSFAVEAVLLIFTLKKMKKKTRCINE